MRATILLVTLSLSLAGCTDEPAGEPLARPSGPSEITRSAIVHHTAQLDELGPRLAGSQQELAASTYVLGHFQQAGYIVRLQGVPVENLVRSTNVIALAPGGDPEFVVAAGYDTPRTYGGDEGPGMLLELARALAAAEPGHSVAFAALGAQQPDADTSGGKALIRFLEEEGDSPSIIYIVDALTAPRFGGARAEELVEVARGLGINATPEAIAPGREASVSEFFFGRRDLDLTVMNGPTPILAEILFEYFT